MKNTRLYKPIVWFVKMLIVYTEKRQIENSYGFQMMNVFLKKRL